MTAQKFLETLGFQDNDVQQYLGAFQRYLDVLQIDEHHLTTVYSRLRGCFDLSLCSVKGILKLLLVEMLKELIVNEQAPPKIEVAVPSPLAYTLMLQKILPDYRFSFREYLFYFLSTCIFGANQEIMEQLSGRIRTCHVCGLIAMRRSGLWYELAQKPVAILTIMPFCDEAAKVAEEYSVLEQIKSFHISSSDSIEYTAQALRQTVHEIGGTPSKHVDMTHVLQRKIGEYRLVYASLLAIFKLLNTHHNIVPVGNNEISLACTLLLVACDNWYEQAIKLLRLLFRELRQRIAEGVSVISPKGIRVGCSYLSFTTPEIDRAFLQYDIAVTLNELFCPNINAVRNIVDPFEQLSHDWLCQSDFLSPKNRVTHIARLITTYRLESFLFGQFSTDMRLGGNQPMLYALAEMQGIRSHYFALDCWELGKKNYHQYIEEKVYFIRHSKAYL